MLLSLVFDKQATTLNHHPKDVVDRVDTLQMLNVSGAIFYRQPTAGANGTVNRVSLPGGYTFAWTGMKVLKHDGSQHHLVGIQPTVPVEKTIQGIREGRDEFLEKAIEILQ